MGKKTPLFEAHKKLGARIVDFAGFDMPLQYTGIMKEHQWVRSHAGLFDVSHMGEIEVRGTRALDFVSYVTSNDPSALEVFQVQYSAFPTPQGTIVDDLLVYRLPDHFLLVVNASNIEKDYSWLLEHKFEGVEIINKSDEVAELALQGPESEAVLQPLVDFNLSDLKYYWSVKTRILGKDALISRTGYTGEDGFEIYLEPEHIEEVFFKLLEDERVKPAGLGARDTLRLEMGYCLYGNDIDETTNLLEAGLGWITKLNKPDFIGKEALLKIKSEGLKRKRVGFEAKEPRDIPRHGYKIFHNQEEIGVVTSGTYSPSLKKGIGMGYVAKEIAKPGNTIQVDIRGKLSDMEIVKLPFYKSGSIKK